MNLKNLLTAAALVCASSTAFAAAPVWYGQSEGEGFSVDYNITYNEDKTLTITAEIETAEFTDNFNFHIISLSSGEPVQTDWLKLNDEDGDGFYTITTEETFESDVTINAEWYFPFTGGGLYQQSVTYTVGSSNEAPLAIRVKAAAENVTFNSADITYDVTAPEGAEYKVYYKLGDAEAVEATASPVALTGLIEKTEYTCEVYAVMATDSEPLESRHATVTFKTTAENAQEYVYADIHPAAFNNAYLIGEPESARRTIYASLPWSVTYKTDGTAVYSIDLSDVINIVGLNPQIWSAGFKQLTKVGDTNIYEYNFGAQELDATVELSHYLAYNGGNIDFRTPYTNWGMEKEAPVIGEATSLTISASKTAVVLGETIVLTTVAKDENGYYVSADDVEYTVEGGDYALEGSLFTINGAKGTRKVIATAGNLSAEIEITAIMTAASSNLVAGKLGYTNNDHIMGGSIEFVTDENLESELVWNCADTKEHWLVYDLGEEYYIEAVAILFERASATKFTVTLSTAAPAEIAEPVSEIAAYAADDTDKVFAVDNEADVQHYLMHDASTAHRYVTLRTSEAWSNGIYGIKVRDLKVYGSKEKIQTGVSEIVVENDENAPVEYFDLSGRRVNTPAAGLYIRRQGNSVSKVLVK